MIVSGKVEVTFSPTVKVGDETEFELWEDVENSVKIRIEAISQTESYRFMGEEVEQRGAGKNENF